MGKALYLPPPKENEVWVHTCSGLGTTGTAIPIYTGTASTVGTAITYTSDAANGAKFTINEAGIYTMSMSGVRSAGALTMIMSKNASNLTTTTGLAADQSLGPMSLGTAAYGTITAERYLAVGDIVRPHMSAAPNAANGLVSFCITKSNR